MITDGRIGFLLKLALLAIVVVAASAVFVPTSAFAADVCNTKCTESSSPGGSLCGESECESFVVGGGFCTYVGSVVGSDLCIFQDTAALTCKDACEGLFNNCTREKCEGAGNCEFINGTLAADRCIQTGSMALIDSLIPGFWEYAGARAPTSSLDYTLLDSSIYGGSAPPDLCSYTGKVFEVVIGIAGVLAVLMLVIGGFQYVAGASNPSTRSAAKDRITYSLIGLLLALGAWVILNSIDSRLVEGCYEPTSSGPVTIGTAPVTTPPATPVTSLAINEERVCFVRDTTSSLSLKDYLGVNVLAGVSATIGGTSAQCAISVSWPRSARASGLGSVEVYYHLDNKRVKRTIQMASYATCKSLTTPNLPPSVRVEMWDFVGDPFANPPIPPSSPSIPTTPAAPASCP